MPAPIVFTVKCKLCSIVPDERKRMGIKQELLFAQARRHTALASGELEVPPVDHTTMLPYTNMLSTVYTVHQRSLQPRWRHSEKMGRRVIDEMIISIHSNTLGAGNTSSTLAWRNEILQEWCMAGAFLGRSQ